MAKNKTATESIETTAPVKVAKAKKPQMIGEYEVGKEYDFQIAQVAVDHYKNSREGGEEAHSPESVADMAKSIGKHGQLQAGVVGIGDDGTPSLIAGYKRLMAIQQHNKDNPDKALPFRAKVVAANTALQRLLVDIETNLRTTALTPVDHWRAHNLLREEPHKWSDAKIANYYKIDPSYVSHLKALNEVSDEVRAKVKSGEISLTNAKALAKMDLKEQSAALDIAVEYAKEATEFVNDKLPKGEKREFDGKIDNAAMTRALRTLAEKAEDAQKEGEEAKPATTTTEASAEKGQGEASGDKKPKPAPATPPGIKPLTLSEVKAFFKENYGGTNEPEPRKRLMAIFTDLFSGKRQKPLVARLDALINGQPEPTPEKPSKKQKAVEAA